MRTEYFVIEQMNDIKPKNAKKEVLGFLDLIPNKDLEKIGSGG